MVAWVAAGAAAENGGRRRQDNLEVADTSVEAKSAVNRHCGTLTTAPNNARALSIGPEPNNYLLGNVVTINVNIKTLGGGAVYHTGCAIHAELTRMCVMKSG